MADNLHISPAYLSAIENGKREPTEKFINNLFDKYALNINEKNSITRAYQKTIEYISIDISSQSEELQDLGLAFARQFDELSEDKVKRLMEILNDEGDD